MAGEMCGWSKEDENVLEKARMGWHCSVSWAQLGQFLEYLYASAFKMEKFDDMRVIEREA